MMKQIPLLMALLKELQIEADKDSLFLCHDQMDLEDIHVHRRGVVTSLLAIPMIYLYVYAHVCFMQREGTSSYTLTKILCAAGRGDILSNLQNIGTNPAFSCHTAARFTTFDP